MKNPYDCVKSKVENWLDENCYEYFLVFILGGIYVTVYSKISDNDLEKFKKEMGEKLSLKGVSYSNYGNEYEYYCNCPIINKYVNDLNDWLNENNFPFLYVRYSSSISIKCTKKLSDEQISQLEDRFGIRLKEYSLACGFDEISYEFC